MARIVLTFEEHKEEMEMMEQEYKNKIEQIEEYYKSIIEQKDDEIPRLRDEIQDIKDWY
mgnify:FL=1